MRANEAQIGIRFAGPDKLVHLIKAGEVVPSLGRGLMVVIGFEPPESVMVSKNPTLTCPQERVHSLS